MKITFILGCGRSGTSILMRILVGNKWNVPATHITSNCEDSAIAALNEKILDHYGYNYFNAYFEIYPSVSLISAVKNKLIPYTTLQYPIIKDPRMLFMYPQWIRNIDYEFIGIFRNPMEVAESHFKLYPKVSRDKCLKLWLNYNEQLLRVYKKYSFPVLDFNSDTFLEDVAEKLQIEISPNMYDQKKITKSRTGTKDKDIREVYKRLKEISNNKKGGK